MREMASCVSFGPSASLEAGRRDGCTKGRLKLVGDKSGFTDRVRSDRRMNLNRYYPALAFMISTLDRPPQVDQSLGPG